MKRNCRTVVVRSHDGNQAIVAIEKNYPWSLFVLEGGAWRELDCRPLPLAPYTSIDVGTCHEQRSILLVACHQTEWQPIHVWLLSLDDVQSGWHRICYIDPPFQWYFIGPVLVMEESRLVLWNCAKSSEERLHPQWMAQLDLSSVLAERFIPPPKPRTWWQTLLSLFSPGPPTFRPEHFHIHPLPGGSSNQRFSFVSSL